MLLLNYWYLDAPNAFYGRHAIFVREGATQRFEALNQVPDALRRRLLSLRAFDAAGMMVDADVVEGTQIEGLIERLFGDPAADFIQVHHARRGCYAARVERG